MYTNVPVVLIDTVGFDTFERIAEKHLVVERLEELVAKSLKPWVGYADPLTALIWHGTGDGYYLVMKDHPAPVAMLFALELEKNVRLSNEAHKDYPLRLRVGLTFGDVRQAGKQWVSDAFIEAARLVDHARIKELMNDEKRIMVLVTSALFMDKWQNHPDKGTIDLPWTRAELTDKHGKIWKGYVQVEKLLPEKTPDLSPWLHTLLDRTGKIAIRGIGSAPGRNKEAGLYDIEQLYTTLRSNGGSVTLPELLPHHSRLLIEGQPGAGKTTFLRLVAAMLAKDHLAIPCPDGPCWRQRHLGMNKDTAPLLPLFFRLSELAFLLADDKKHHPADDRRRLLDLLANTPNASLDDTWRNHWTTLLEQGRVMLLLDGLDEVADDELRERVFAIVQDAISQWPKTPMVITSRPFGVGRIKGMGFHHVVIDPFGQKEIREFIKRWVDTLFGKSNAGTDQQDALLQAIVEKITIRRLATNPVMLTCLCVVHWNEGKLPEARGRVYQAVIRWLIESRSKWRSDEGFNDQFAMEAFTALALAMMVDGKGGKQAVFDREEAILAVEPLVEEHYRQLSTQRKRQEFAKQWLSFECLGSGIVEELGNHQLKFWHLTFQENLAAQALAWKGEGEKEGEDWWPVIKKYLDDPQWRETVTLFPGALFGDGDRRRVNRLLQRVLALRGENPTLATDARITGIMGRLLEPMAAYQYQPPQEIEQTYGQIRDRTMAIFTKEGAAQVDVKTRIQAAEALGQSGDPRLSQDNFPSLPDPKWTLGKYLVTVGEYQTFVEQDGYMEQGWWDEAGWKWRMAKGFQSPDNWDDQLLHLNRPVTHVSWFEAMAYCRWSSEQKKMVIRLPNEIIWKKAVSSQGNYPWGREEPTPELANYDGNVGSPTPVGIYPAGDGPYGHCDLAGNVWEWCRNLHQNNDAETPLDPVVTEGDAPAWRGGSWRYGAATLRSAFRYGNHAVDRFVDVGFRLAAAPASMLAP